MAGEPIRAARTKAPGNDQSSVGQEVKTNSRLVRGTGSGTEDVSKIYAESFRGADHLKRIQSDARAAMREGFRLAGSLVMRVLLTGSSKKNGASSHQDCAHRAMA